MTFTLLAEMSEGRIKINSPPLAQNNHFMNKSFELTSKSGKQYPAAMSSEASESGYSAFRISEKYFKSRSITGPARKWLRKIKADPSATYPLLQGQGVMDLSRPDIASGKEDAVRRAGWKADEDITGGRPLRKVQVTKPLTTGETSHLDGYILGDGA